jgi:hypothetical protein
VTQSTSSRQASSVQSLLETQLTIAADLQELIRSQSSSLSPREYKELATATSNLIGLAHKTDETLKTIQSYRVFVDVVLDFLRQRSDSLGEDLLAELREVAKGLKAEVALDEVAEQV